VTAITSIGLDHQQHLGASVREIAREKAGIVKHGTPLVLGPVASDARDVIAGAARDEDAQLVDAFDGVSVQPVDEHRIRLRTPSRDYGSIELALRGRHQIANAVVAVRVLELLDHQGVPVSPTAVVEGLGRVQWPGRLERRVFADGREILLDAAHNPDGAAALAAYIAAQCPEPPPIVFGVMRDKDAAAMLRHLGAVAGAFVLTRPSGSRAADPLELVDFARAAASGRTVIVEPAPAAALAAAWRLAPRIVAAGSVVLLGDLIVEFDRS
jgi:dihydrofolate synthase / folylpolyglutamate synthase